MRSLAPGLIVLILLNFAGCGKSDATAAKDAADTSKPIAGTAVSKSTTMEGRWVRITSGEFDSLEFLKDDRVLVSDQGGSAVPFTYDILDGGRMSMSMGNGLTAV